MKKVKSPQLYVLAKDESLGYIQENNLVAGDLLPPGIISHTFFQDFTGGSLYTYMEERLGIELTNSMIQIQPIKVSKSIIK